MTHYLKSGGIWITGLLGVLLSPMAHSQIQFSNVTNSAGNFFFGESWGASWGDINSDALPDLFVNNHRLLPSLYRNNGNGTFLDIAQQVDGSGTWFNNPLFDQHGGAWVDYDSDGDQDLTVATGTCCAPQFFTNNNGVFTDETASRGIIDDGGGRMAFFFDYNRDNLIDLALMNSGTSKLMMQNNDGSFSQVFNNTSGFRCGGFRSNYSQLSDLDDDVEMGGTMEALCMQDGLSPAKVFNTEQTPFTDITSSVPSEGAVVDTIIGDFDGNLSPDIFMLRGGLRFNQAIKADARYIEGRLQAGPGEQRELSFTASGIVSVTFHSITTAKQGDPSKIFIGANGVHPNDGMNFILNPNNSDHHGIKPHTPGSDTGLYVGYVGGKWKLQLVSASKGTRAYLVITAADAIGEPTITPLLAVDQAMLPKMYMNNGGTFVQEADSRGFGNKIACVSGVAADFDNDMDLDLYFACRGGAENLANRLYMNNGSGNFTEVNNAGGAKGVTGVTLYDAAGVSDSVVRADYDVDGMVDIFVTNGLNLQPFREGGGPSQLFRNSTSNSNRWIELDLVGTTSNRDAIGAKVYATVNPGAPVEVKQMRQQDGGYHRWSQDHQRIHFGLGPNNAVDITVHWPSGLTETHPNVAANKLYKVTEGGDIVAIDITPAEPPGVECGKPGYNKAQEQGLFIWKDCAITGSENWIVRATGGGSSSVINYEGMVSSSQNFTSLTPFSIESNDTLDNSDPKIIEYVMKIVKAGQDGFSFRFTKNATTAVCFNPDKLPSGASAYLGSGRQQVTGPFDLITLAPCTPPADSDLECGKPSYNKVTEKSIFIWKDCAGSGLWHLRATAGGNPTTITYKANITSSQGFTSLTETSIESNDTVDNLSDPDKIDLELKLKKRGEDGINFGFPDAANSCFTLTGKPAGADVRLGAEKEVVTGSFDLHTQATCP